MGKTCSCFRDSKNTQPRGEVSLERPTYDDNEKTMKGGAKQRSAKGDDEKKFFALTKKMDIPHESSKVRLTLNVHFQKIHKKNGPYTYPDTMKDDKVRYLKDQITLSSGHIFVGFWYLNPSIKIFQG